MYQDPEAESGFKVDVAIIGGGPSGCSTALTLLNHSQRSVLLVESSDYQLQRVGEVISPAIVPLLSFLSPTLQLDADRYIQTIENKIVWGNPAVFSRNSQFSPYGSNLHLARNEFDKSLSNEVQNSGGIVLTKARIRTLKFTTANDWEGTVVANNKARKFQCNYIVDASGKKAILARKLLIKHRMLDKLVGVTGFFQLAGNAPDLFVMEACSFGWWYASKLPSGVLSVTLMTDADICRRERLHKVENWCQCLNTLKSLPAIVNPTGLPQKIHIRPAHTQIIECFSGNGWMATGEAAVSFDPLSAMGIGHAISSGVACGQTVDRLLEGDGGLLKNYFQTIAVTLNNYLQTRMLYYRAERRWSKEIFWQRRH